MIEELRLAKEDRAKEEKHFKNDKDVIIDANEDGISDEYGLKEGGGKKKVKKIPMNQLLTKTNPL